MAYSDKLVDRETERLREIVAEPLWYKEIYRESRARRLGQGALYAALKGLRLPEDIKAEIKDLRESAFERLLAEGAVYVGNVVYDWDQERRPVDAVVIHHTSRPPGITKQRLESIHLQQVYVPVFARPEPVDIDKGIKDVPLYSGHVHDGRQVFQIYHWLVRNDGQAERLLDDNEIGWQAGRWDVNRRSVGICIDDDLEHKAPNPKVLDSIARIINQHYPDITEHPETIIGHREVGGPKPTTCPGDKFLPGWKRDLLTRLS